MQARRHNTFAHNFSMFQFNNFSSVFYWKCFMSTGAIHSLYFFLRFNWTISAERQFRRYNTLAEKFWMFQHNNFSSEFWKNFQVRRHNILAEILKFQLMSFSSRFLAKNLQKGKHNTLAKKFGCFYTKIWAKMNIENFFNSKGTICSLKVFYVSID